MTFTEFDKIWSDLKLRCPTWQLAMQKHTDFGKVSDLYYKDFLKAHVTIAELEYAADRIYKDYVNFEANKEKGDYHAFQPPARFIYFAKEFRKQAKERTEEYCPCCGNTGLIVASEAQLEATPVRNRKHKGLYTGNLAMGCACGRQPNASRFKKYFPEPSDKCNAKSRCEATPGTGKCVCPLGVEHWKKIQDQRLDQVLRDPFYIKGLEIQERIHEIRKRATYRGKRKISGLSSAGELLGKELNEGLPF